MPARRRSGGAGAGGGNARISFLLRQAGEDDKGLLFSSPRIDETGHLRAETKGEADPALGGHVDLPIFAGQGVDRHGALRLQFPADVTGFAGADSNNIVVRLFRNDSFARTPQVAWTAASGQLTILLGSTVTVADVRTAIDGLSGITIANTLTGAANGSDNLLLGGNLEAVDRNLVGGRDEIPPGIDLLAQPDDEVNGPNILVKYDPADETTLQALLDELEENDQGVTIVVPFGTDLTAAPEAVPFVRAYQGLSGEAPSTGTGGLTQNQVDARVRALSKGYALRGGPDVPDSEIGSGIARDSEIKPYARTGGGQVPESDIPDAITRDDELKSWARVGGGNVPEGQVDSRLARDTEVDAIRHNLSLKDVRNIVRNTDGTLEIELNDGTTLQTGKDLKSVRDQGAYSGAITYGERDLVLHGGGWYLANRTGFSGIEPRVTANWRNWWDFLCWQDGAPDSLVGAPTVDSGTGELVTRTRGGHENRAPLPSGGTAVSANPAGTDGDPLTRLAVAGANYYIPQGYAWYARPTLSVPASITTDTNVGTAGRVFDLLNAETIDGGILAGVDFTTEWFGCFEINIAAPGSGDAKARSLSATLITTHAFNGKSIVHERSADIGITENQFLCVPLSIFNSISRVSLGAYRPADGDSDGSDDVEITAADLAGTVDISYQIRLQGKGRTGADAAFTIEDLIWMRPVARSYQIVHGEGGALPGPTPPAVRPSISSYTRLSGDLTPVAGSIAGERYGLAWQIAQSDHVGAARILGFKGAYGDGMAATVIQNIDAGTSVDGQPNVGWANGQAEVLIPNGVTLADGEHYTLRLQVFAEGVTSPGLTTAPEAYQDITITAHAAATASVHWGAIAKVDGRSVADTVAAIDFSTDDDATGTALAAAYTAALPDDGNEYQVYLAVAASLDQPSGFTLGGQPYAGFEDAEDKTVSSTAYKVYLQSAAVALTHDEGNGLRYGVTV